MAPHSNAAGELMSTAPEATKWKISDSVSVSNAVTPQEFLSFSGNVVYGPTMSILAATSALRAAGAQSTNTCLHAAHSSTPYPGCRGYTAR